jgi:hypothetical protein
VTCGRQRCDYPVLIIVLRLGLNDAQPLVTRRNTSGTDFPCTAMLPPYCGAYGRPRRYASGYRVLPPKCGVDNLPRSTPRKLCYLILGVPLKLGTYNCQGATFPNVRCTASPLDTKEDSCYSRLVLKRQHTSSPILGNIKLRCSNLRYLMKMLTGTYNTQNLQGKL